MAKRRTTPEEPNELAELRAEIVDLKGHIRTLIDAIDDVRTELQYLATNRTAQAGTQVTSPVLKQMALDPAAADWNERLVVAGRSGKSSEASTTGSSANPQPLPQRKPTALEATDAVEFVHDGNEAFGEIVSIDESRQEATVMLIPSEERVVVPLNSLTWVDPRDDEAEPLSIKEAATQSEPASKSQQSHTSARNKPPPGKPFGSPGDQSRLF